MSLKSLISLISLGCILLLSACSKPCPDLSSKKIKLLKPIPTQKFKLVGVVYNAKGKPVGGHFDSESTYRFIRAFKKLRYQVSYYTNEIKAKGLALSDKNIKTKK